MKIFLLTFFYIAIVFFPNPLKSQDKTWMFKTLNTSNGLASMYVVSLEQDVDGFIWMGTTNGLSRFDGRNFKNYHSKYNDSTSLPANNISKVLSDSKGRLLVASSAGLCIYNKEFDNFKHIKHAENIDVRNFIEAKDGRFWAATSDGLEVFSNDFKTSKKYLHDAKNPNSIPENNLYCIIEDKLNSNFLWLGTRSGYICKFDKQSGVCSQTKCLGVNNEMIKFLNNINDSLLFVNVCNLKVMVLNKKNLDEIEIHNKMIIENNAVNAIANFENGSILGTENGVVSFSKELILSNHAFTNFTKGKNINSILKDKQGNFWMSSFKNGVVYAYKTYKNFNSSFAETIKQQMVVSMVKDNENNYWVGTDGMGLYRFDANFQLKRHYWSGLKNDAKFYSIFKIFQSKNGDIYIGTYNGFYKYDKKNDAFKQFVKSSTDVSSISHNDVRDIIEDSQGQIWLSTNGGGLNLFDPKSGKFTRFQHSDLKNSIVNDYCIRLFMSSDSLLWISSYFGVSCLDTKKRVFKNYDPITYHLSSHWIYAISEDKAHNMWFGSANGIIILNTKTNKITNKFKEDGLPEDQINGLLNDKYGNIWISTSQNITKFDVQEQKFIIYSKSDGLQIDEFKNSSYYQDNDGMFYFGGQAGLVTFYPSEIKYNPHIPKIIVYDLQLFNKSIEISNEKEAILNKSIAYTKELSLDYTQNIITLKFAALNYINPQNNRFACQMEGFETKYLDLGNNAEATYTNLNPGEYNFKVIACNNDGVWNLNPTTIKIIIKPPFWRTKWMYALEVLAIGALIILIGKWWLKRQNDKQQIKIERLEANKMHEIDLLKLQVFTNISHEFRTPLTLIIGPLEKLINKLENTQEQNYYSLMYKNAHRMLRLVNQLLDFRKLEAGQLKLEATNDDLVLFVRNIALSFTLMAEHHKINFQFKPSFDTFSLWFDPDKLDKMLYNLISNAFKFTLEGGSISIFIDDLKLTSKDENGLDEFIEIKVVDSGIGIANDAIDKIFSVFFQAENTKTNQNKGTGIGLALTKELVLLHKGKILVNSDLNKGSIFSLLLPKGNKHLTKNQMHENHYHFSDIKPEMDLNIENLRVNETKIVDSHDENIPLVMVVDDNDEMRLFIKTELSEKYRVIEANDGKPGFELACQEIPDLIVSDVMMSEMDGIEFCEKIKTDPKTCHIPFILLTARKSEEHNLEGLNTGADDYITKPFSVQILMARIANLIESRKRLRDLFGKGISIEPAKMTSNPIDAAFMQKAIELVELNLANGSFGIDDLALALHLNRAQLYKKLKSLTNQTIYDFIRTIRLNKAAEMLLAGNMNITQVAYAIGYAELPNFSRSFQAQFGESPKSFIARRRAEL